MQTGERPWATPAAWDRGPSTAAPHPLLQSGDGFISNTSHHNAYFYPGSESQMIIAGMDLIVSSEQRCNGISQWGKQMRLTGPEWT